MKVTLEIQEDCLKKLIEDNKNTIVGKGESSDVRERIKTYEDACHELGIKPMDESKMRSIGFTDAEIARRKIKEITEVLNEGWIADWNDRNQEKWLPRFYVLVSAGFTFYDASYSCMNPNAGDASRLCFKSEELATYAGRQFLALYKLTIY